MGTTKIEWAEKVWNPITGCTKISPGCVHCYAERMSKRLAGRCGYPAGNPFQVTVHKDKFDDPYHWRKPRRVFACSMGDLFHPDVNFYDIAHVFGVMHSAKQHTYMLLTKRPERMQEFIKWFQDEWLGPFASAWPREYPHVRLGVTAENQAMADKRIPILLQIPAAVYFISHEPALGPIIYPPEFLALGSRAQIITGGESGPNARPMHPGWARQDRDQAVSAGVKFLFKQHGEWVPNDQRWHDHDHLLSFTQTFTQKHVALEGIFMCRVGKKASGRLLDGRTWDEIPS